MKIYSDVLDISEVRKEACDVLFIVGCWPLSHPKLRRSGWVIQTSGIMSNRFKNTGNSGASDEYAASWDDHGRYFARIFEADPRALIVAAARYDGAEEFHTKTKGAYR